MFPAVAIDFGTDTAALAARQVIEACSSAVAAGWCERSGGKGEPPRSLASVRARSPLEIVIELQLPGAAAVGGRLVRVLEFSASDPRAERWASVGLAVATLVGENVEEVRQADPSRASRTAGTPATDAEALGDETLRDETLGDETLGSETLSNAPPGDARQVARTREIESTPEGDRGKAPTPRPVTGLLLNFGVLSGTGSDETAVRWGAVVRGAWITPGGFRISTTADYATLAAESSSVEVTWLRASIGAGHSVWVAGPWMLFADLEAGVRRLSVDAVTVEGSDASQVRWSPLMSGRLELGWLPASFAGISAGLEASTIFRQTRLFAGAAAQPDASLPAVELSAMLGLYWKVE